MNSPKNGLNNLKEKYKHDNQSINYSLSTTKFENPELIKINPNQTTNEFMNQTMTMMDTKNRKEHSLPKLNNNFNKKNKKRTELLGNNTGVDLSIDVNNNSMIDDEEFDEKNNNSMPKEVVKIFKKNVY